MCALAALIGEEFAAQLLAYLGPERFGKMQRANIANIGGPCCASHDFCDSNVFMAAAFQAVTGREPFASDEDSATDADCALWRAAWSYAQPLRLTAPQNILDYFTAAGFSAEGIDAARIAAMQSMPTDSNCGDDCRKAIDSAKAFADAVRMAFGDDFGFLAQLTDILAATCGCYITG
jgi:hypothetical protein